MANTNNIKVQGIIFKIVNNEYQFLLLKKGIAWKTISGNYKNKDCTLHNSIIRKVKEDIGLDSWFIRKIHYNIYSFSLDKNYGNNEYVFGIQVEFNFIPEINKNKFDSYEWFTYLGTVIKLKSNNDKIALKKLIEKIK